MHRDHLGARQEVEQRAVDLDWLADEAEVEHALDVGIGILDLLLRLLGKHHVAVLAAQPDRPLALGVDQRHDLLVDRAGQHHLDDLDRLLVGHPEPALEPRLDAHLGKHRADLRTAAMHHDRVDAGLLEQRDVAGEGLAERRIAHGMTAIFHHDGLVLVALHVGKRFGQQARLLGGGGNFRHDVLAREGECAAS